MRPTRSPERKVLTLSEIAQSYLTDFRLSPETLEKG